MENTVIAYDNLDLDDTTLVLAPAPYVADKIDIHKEKDWNEFLRVIGIANMNFQKKERNIKDEVLASQGGTIASRFSRFEPRQKAIDEINRKFGNIILDNGEKVLPKKIEVSYYDGLPSSKENEEIEDMEVEKMIFNYNNGYFLGVPFLPPNCQKPPTIYSILESIVNGNVDLNEPAPEVKIKDLAKEGRKTIFNFDYP